MENNDQQKVGSGYIKMDFSLSDPAACVEKTKEIIANTPSEKLTPYYLEKLANYIIFSGMDKKERLSHVITTDNRLKTRRDRELSFEGLVERLENGEDGIYSMIANDKNIIFSPKIGITEEDIQNIPGMRELVEEIDKVEARKAGARGHKAFLLQKQLIEMRKDQYVLKAAYCKPIKLLNAKKTFSTLDLTEKIYLDAEGNVKSTGFINLFTPEHVSLLLCNYSRIKEECWDKFTSDIHWMMEDLDSLVDKTFKEAFPLYYDLIIYKIDGKSNSEIQRLLDKDYNILHSVEYISALWRNKIPKMIAETAAKEWLIWHYTQEEQGYWKKCSRCGQIKLGHNYFFSKNNTSKDGWYSICKDCRNNKTGKILPKGRS